MGFVEYAAIVGWVIVILQNGFRIARWIKGKVKEAKELKQ